MAIASILHRLSGIALFLFFPAVLYFFDLSAQGPDGFEEIHRLFMCLIPKLIIWIFTIALIYHFLAGVRHLLMDIGIGETVCAGRRSSIIVIFLSIIFTIFLGMKLW